MFNFVYVIDSCTSEMIEVLKMIVMIGECILIIGAGAISLSSFYLAFDKIKGKTVLIAISIMFTL